MQKKKPFLILKCGKRYPLLYQKADEDNISCTKNATKKPSPIPKCKKKDTFCYTKYSEKDNTSFTKNAEKDTFLGFFSSDTCKCRATS